MVVILNLLIVIESEVETFTNEAKFSERYL